MTRPKTRGERRKRNFLAKSLSDRKYHQRVIDPEQYRRPSKRELLNEAEDVEDELQASLRRADVLPSSHLDDK